MYICATTLQWYVDDGVELAEAAIVLQEHRVPALCMRIQFKYSNEFKQCVPAGINIGGVSSWRRLTTTNASIISNKPDLKKFLAVPFIFFKRH
jgi:hypothetical protein